MFSPFFVIHLFYKENLNTFTKLATAATATVVTICAATTASTVRTKEKDDDKDNNPTAIVAKYVTH